MSQLQTDLYRRIADRLDQWASDSSDLYDTAGIDEKQANEDIFIAAYFFLIRSMVIFDVDPDEFADCMKQTIERVKRKQRR